ncbi:MAG: hypothetical protein VBE63_17595, partial [Lamprobacter sp.]|nr:hypothetical protein [Lamprobacter sp.]
EALTNQPARAAAGFDLDQSIAEGKVDFGQGRLIDLELRVRGYLVSLLSKCPLTTSRFIVPTVSKNYALSVQDF